MANLHKIALQNHLGGHICHVLPHDALRMEREGSVRLKRKHGNICSARQVPPPVNPSNSPVSPCSLTCSEIRANAFGALKIKLGEKLTGYERRAMDKVMNYGPASFADRIVYA